MARASRPRSEGRKARVAPGSCRTAKMAGSREVLGGHYADLTGGGTRVCRRHPHRVVLRRWYADPSDEHLELHRPSIRRTALRRPRRRVRRQGSSRRGSVTGQRSLTGRRSPNDGMGILVVGTSGRGSGRRRTCGPRAFLSWVPELPMISRVGKPPTTRLCRHSASGNRCLRWWVAVVRQRSFRPSGNWTTPATDGGSWAVMTRNEHLSTVGPRWSGLK